MNNDHSKHPSLKGQRKKRTQSVLFQTTPTHRLAAKGKSTSNKQKEKRRRVVSNYSSKVKQAMSEQPPYIQRVEHFSTVKAKPVLPQESNRHHFTTVGDLKECVVEESPQASLYQQLPQSKISEIPPERGRGEVGVQTELGGAMGAEMLQRGLEESISKLRSKQETIDMLNRTIRSRLVEGVEGAEWKQGYPESMSRAELIQFEVQFYIQKIGELQKDLYEKEKMMEVLMRKHVDAEGQSKDNRNLLWENGRLKEEKVLLQRENDALKNLLRRQEKRTM